MEKSGFQKTLKKIDLENFRSKSFSIRTSEGRAPASELVLQRGSLPSEIALQGCMQDTFARAMHSARPSARDDRVSCIQITRGKPRVLNGISRGRCGLRKTEKIFSANNEKNT